MGFFSFFKEARDAKSVMVAHANMTQEELLSLDNESLYTVLSDRLEYVTQYMDDAEDCLDRLHGAVRIFYIVNYYELEMNSGGLCQYFVNSSRATAPYILDALDEIEAQKHMNLLGEFVDKYDINLDDLESFVIDDIDDFEQQAERYPFEEFDDAFYELYDEEHLSDVLVEYCRGHIDEFAEE